MRVLIASALAVVVAVGASAEDKGVAAQWGSLKSTTPAGWKEETPSNTMRVGQFKLPKEKGDPEDAELAIFKSPGGGGVQANLERQEKKFELPAGKKAEDVIKTEKLKFGDKHEGAYQDIQGTLLKKFPPFDPNAKVTKVADYRQIYVVFDVKDGDSSVLYSMTLLGPAKTVEKHKKAFDEWVKNFK
jgi:hypothetical protein